MSERNKEKEKPARKAGLKVGRYRRGRLFSDILNDENIVFIKGVLQIYLSWIGEAIDSIVVNTAIACRGVDCRR